MAPRAASWCCAYGALFGSGRGTVWGNAGGAPPPPRGIVSVVLTPLAAAPAPHPARKERCQTRPRPSTAAPTVTFPCPVVL